AVPHVLLAKALWEWQPSKFDWLCICPEVNLVILLIIFRAYARHSMDDAPVERQQEAGDKNDPAGERTVGQDACPALKSEECDSHALNMLADLALSSCNTPLVSVSSKPSLPFSPSRDRRRLQRGKPLHKSSDHEYHRATKKWKGISLSSKTCQKSLVSPGQGSLSVESRSHSQERGRVSSSRKGRAGPAKPHIVLPKEAGDLSDSSMNSLISSEHSYASPVSESLKKGALGSPSAKNGLKNAKSGPLVGKVLPFRHQENICHPHKQFKNYVPFLRSAIMAARLKDDFSKSHKVAFCDKTVKVTFQWESEYLFSFDSKYTNNSLEKTVIRAVHGPWDISRSDEVEEMKLILHMWVALFYSKPFKSPTVRKVVEHSNPAKYVSLNSVVDPLELTDDCEGSYSLEKCPADSFSDANHMPSDVEERAVSPSEKPLSCNELSSTNCLEDETPLINPEESRELPSMEEQCMDANAYVFQQGKGINSADLACTQTSELFQLQKDRAAQGEEAGSQGSPVPETTPVFADPVSVVDISCLPTENQGVNLAASISGHASPVHHTVPNKEFPEASKDPAESTRFPVSPNLMDFIEDISQESIHLADLHTSEHGQVQNGMSAQGESIENQEDTVMSASNLAEDMDWVCESCVPQAEEENIPADAALLQATPGGHTPSNKIAELSGSQGIPAVATKSAALPEQASMTEDSCAHQENKVVLPDMAPVHTDKLHQVQHRTVTHKVPKTGPVPELQKDSQGKKESQHLGLECMELDANSEKEMFCVSVGNAGASSVTQAVASEDKELNSTGVPVSEDTKAVVSELIDTVSAAAVEGEDSSAKENPDLNWISSITLECVTPPESDEESCTMGPWPQADPTWMAGECLEQLSTFADQERAIVQEQGQCPLVLHGRVRSGPAGMSARSPLREEEVASMDMDVHLSPCSSDWPEKDTASIDCNSPLAQPGVSSMDDRSTTPMLCDAGPGGASHDASASQGEVQFKGVSIEILATVPARCQKEHSSEGSDSAMHENTRGSLEGPEVSPTGETSPAGAVDTNMSWEKESFSVDGDQEVVEDPCHGSGSKSSCRGSAVAPGGGYSRDLDLDEDICTNGDWMYPENEKGSAAEREAMKRDWHFTFKEDDRSVSPLLETDNQPGLLKDYINFSVTKKHKEKTRTFHSSKGQDSFTGELGFIHSLNRTWRILNDPVQNTLDMECLRFHYKVKQVLKNPQYSTSTDTFTKGFSPQVIAETLPLRKVPDTDVSSPPPRSRSPLLITVVNPGPKPRGPPVTCTQDSVSSAARAQCQGQSSTTPFHLNKLTYNNKLKDFRGNISVIMDEFAELSRVMMLDDRLTNNKGRDLKTTSEVAPEKSCPGRAASYEHLFNELCNALHFRLKNVAQEACKKPYAFYLMETDNDPFFGRVKNLLKKGGHTEAEPLRFCQTSHMETDKLMVVIRNEDIFPHIHKIPALLRLKHLPSVTFAGVDSPEDILEHTYQELFHSGGFVVTDDTVAVTILGLIKEVLQTLEQLSGHGRWKWLLHYKERKKLKESARVDPAARAKEALLQPCLGANIASVLHYHQCDCRSCPRDEFANCLLSLQAQHASERFAVFLTGRKPAREALESKGILVLDVNTFLATARDLVTPFRSSYW
uniref:Protein FAM208B n=1 Tax=Varanus komodoensis TaxID=61221 RepID=A0A8D2ILV2_VARKO